MTGAFAQDLETAYQNAAALLRFTDDRMQLTNAREVFSSLGSYGQSENLATYAQGLLDLAYERYAQAHQGFSSLADNAGLRQALEDAGLPDAHSLEKYAWACACELSGDYPQACELSSECSVLDASQRLRGIRTGTFPALYREALRLLDLGYAQDAKGILTMLSDAGCGEAAASLADMEAEERGYTFQDETMGQVIREVLGKARGEPVFLWEMARIEEIDEDRKVSKRNTIRTLEDLRHCTNLRILMISCHEGVRDLSPLMGLEGLFRIYIPGCSVSDLSPVRGIKSLTHLSVIQNGVSDLSPLSDVTDLESLHINGNPEIKDLSPLDNLTRITYLQYGRKTVPGSQIRSFKALHPNCRYEPKG